MHISGRDVIGDWNWVGQMHRETKFKIVQRGKISRAKTQRRNETAPRKLTPPTFNMEYKSTRSENYSQKLHSRIESSSGTEDCLTKSVESNIRQAVVCFKPANEELTLLPPVISKNSRAIRCKAFIPACTVSGARSDRQGQGDQDSRTQLSAKSAEASSVTISTISAWQIRCVVLLVPIKKQHLLDAFREF